MSKSDEQRDIDRARERADLARLRFGNAVNGVLQRLAPERLTADVVEAATDQIQNAKRDLLQKFKHWPVVAASIFLAAAAMAFWRPARVVGSYAFRLASVVLATQKVWRRTQ